jgi:hypothetical protein
MIHGFFKRKKGGLKLKTEILEGQKSEGKFYRTKSKKFVFRGTKIIFNLILYMFPISYYLSGSTHNPLIFVFLLCSLMTINSPLNVNK